MSNLVRVVRKKKLAKESEDERNSKKRPRIQSQAVANAIKDALSKSAKSPKGEKFSVKKKKEQDITNFKKFASNLPPPPVTSVFSTKKKSKQDDNQLVTTMSASQSNLLKDKSNQDKKLVKPSTSTKDKSNQDKNLLKPSTSTKDKSNQDKNVLKHSTSSSQPNPEFELIKDNINNENKKTKSNDSQKKPKQSCPYFSRYHKACPSRGNITNESLAAALCAISCKLTYFFTCSFKFNFLGVI